MNDKILHIKNIQIEGEDQKSILEIDDFFIYKNEKLGIKGPSGAGKSTFLHLITGLIIPRYGDVIWEKTNIAKLAESKRDSFRNENIGMVFQNSFLFEELDIFENIAISSSFSSKEQRKSINENTQKYLEYFNLGDVTNRSVESYSGGERQRICVARALSTDPKIIVADEPTASLDTKNANLLIDDLVNLSTQKSKTLIVVSHDEELLQKMDRIITITNGKIISEERV